MCSLPLLLVCWAFIESPLVQVSSSTNIEVKTKLLLMFSVDRVGGWRWCDVWKECQLTCVPPHISFFSEKAERMETSGRTELPPAAEMASVEEEEGEVDPNLWVSAVSYSVLVVFCY